MDRRWAGMLVVMLCLVAATVVSGLTHTTIPGRPRLGAPPGPPIIGDCVIDPVEPGVVRQLDDGPVAAYPPARTTPCQGPRAGEVVDITEHPPGRPSAIQTTVTDTINGMPFTWPLAVDPVAAACQQAAENYAGIPADERWSADREFGGQSLPPNQWHGTAAVHSSEFAPTARQSADGQSWAACAVLPNDYGPIFGSSMRDIYRSSFPAGDLVSVCESNGADGQGGGAQRCDTAHRFEDFATAQVSGALSGDGLERNCRALIVARTQLTDPTVHGQLTVHVSATFSDGTVVPQEGFGAGGSATCQLMTVDPHRSLYHSLANIGTRPLPWSPS